MFERFRARRRAAPEPPPPPPPLTAERRAELAAEVDDLLRPGFRTRDDVVSHLTASGDDAPAVSRAEVVALVDERWQARLAEQRDWPARTDADRLEDAFAALDRSGTVARANFSCCSTCAFEEIDGERPADGRSDGFVLFHEQDAERLGVLDTALHLAFGSWDTDGDAATRAERTSRVGQRVRAALQDHGLAVEWNGHPGVRILVLLPDGRRRLPG